MLLALVSASFTFNPKEGIDNPALVVCDDPGEAHRAWAGLSRAAGPPERALCAGPGPSPSPRTCHLKRLQGQNFGFCLRAEGSSRALEVQTVEPCSPAELSGLRDGDRVLEVNEEFVDKTHFHKVGVQKSADQIHHSRREEPLGDDTEFLSPDRW